MPLHILVLGAAAGGGLPQWNCNGPQSRGFWTGVGALPPASQSSLAVSGDGETWAVINASPDLRAQILARPALQPRDPGRFGLRDTPICAVLLTNGDVDHVAGLLSLRESQAFELFATAAIHQVLRDNPIFQALNPVFVARKTADLDQDFTLAPGVTARLFPVPGKVPLYLEGAGPVVTDALGEETVGVELSAGDARFFYVPGCAKMTGDLADRLCGAALVLFDGTVYLDDEMIHAGVGQKTGRRMGHMAMAGAGGSLDAFAALDVARKIYIHINNTNPVWCPTSVERRAVTAAGWEIAYDGMEIVL